MGEYLSLLTTATFSSPSFLLILMILCGQWCWLCWAWDLSWTLYNISDQGKQNLGRMHADISGITTLHCAWSWNERIKNTRPGNMVWKLGRWWSSWGDVSEVLDYDGGHGDVDNVLKKDGGNNDVDDGGDDPLILKEMWCRRLAMPSWLLCKYKRKMVGEFQVKFLSSTNDSHL